MFKGHEIFYAMATNQDERAKQLIENSDLQNAVDNSGSTFLHWAVKANNKNIVKYLIDKGYSANTIGFLSYTPLIQAIVLNHEHIVKLLLENNADITLLNNRLDSALSLTLEEQHISDSIVQLILEHAHKLCDTSKQTAERLIRENCGLFQAAFLKNTSIIKYMLKYFSVNDAHWVKKQTALHVATGLDDIKMVELLIEHRACVEALDCDGASVLNYIYKFNVKHNSNKLELLKLFLREGLSPTSLTKKGAFQVSHTLINGNYKAIRILLQSQIDCSSRDVESGKSLLHYLALNTNSGVIETLKPHVKKFNVNSCDYFNTTALYYASKAGNLEMLKLLLSENAEINCKHSVYNFTPLHQVYTESKPGFEKQYDKCAKLLLQHNANSQFIIEQNDEQITVFDIVSGKTRIKSVISQIALLESLGTEILDIIRYKINSKRSSKKYLKRCKRILNKRISGSVTVFKFLNCSRRKTVQYASQEKRLRKSRDIKHRKKLKKSFPCYYSKIKARISRATNIWEKSNMINETVCKLSQNKLNMSHYIIIDNIVDYLNDQDLESLYKIGMDF